MPWSSTEANFSTSVSRKNKASFLLGAEYLQRNFYPLKNNPWEFANRVKMWSVDLEMADDCVLPGILREVLQEYWVQGCI